MSAQQVRLLPNLLRVGRDVVVSDGPLIPLTTMLETFPPRGESAARKHSHETDEPREIDREQQLAAMFPNLKKYDKEGGGWGG